ncbi:lytic transglycosylase domain-containing protein [Pseudomarimonas arenosa]|uniref:LysM peptidoglycan-binding domain-containing protein n=1 Tax=Pseudomarimonas arenosa TaxID=2774145 RepID=A0AAW3ZLI1_9GAMM|nr:lytic transglycosylase domain-containing protein [Pseudomarimonas arenosa]MBD8526047.1 LysM peptidoglycan-binding domain-containing protein [Pseudomarimonas arenosa]
MERRVLIGHAWIRRAGLFTLLMALVGCVSVPPPIPPAASVRSQPTAESIPATDATPISPAPTPEPPVAEPSTIDLRAALLSSLPAALDCQAFPATKARPYTVKILGTTLSKRLPMLDYVLRELETEQLSSLYALVPLIESQLQTDPGNRGAVRGMWQFSTDTARLYDLLPPSGVDRRLDAVAATIAARRHLQQLHEQFGDWRLVLAAYNAGPYRVQRAISTFPDSRSAAENLHALRLPAHTLGYINRIGALACLIKQQEELGISMQLPVERRLQALSITDCRAAATAGTPARSVEPATELNPLLRQPARLPADFRLLISNSQGCSSVWLTERMVESQSGDGARSYRVRAGDSLWSISRKIGVSIEDLLRWNQLRREATLRIGQVLRLAP